MGETKLKPNNSLRTPKHKKKLGLAVPPALRLPHDDLIIPQVKPNKQHPESEIKSLPSTTSTTSQTSQTRQTQEDHPISPERDFTKVANSINRQAVPAGLFGGKSKQLYDCLYTLTRGAIVPARSVRISRPKLMKKAGIGSRVTFDSNVERLIAVGLLVVRQIVGEHDGNEYTIFLPEETNPSMTSLTSHSSQTSLTGYAQKLDRLVCLETSQTSHSLSADLSTLSNTSKTSFKTSDLRDDDEAFAELVKILSQAVYEVTGIKPVASEKNRWLELGELLATEFKIAAARTTVSSAPAFFTEHLRRRLWKMDKKPAYPEKSQTQGDVTAVQPTEFVKNCLDCGGTGFYYPQGYEQGVARCKHLRISKEVPETKRLITSELEEQVKIIGELLAGGYSVEQAEEQFKASLHTDDWQYIVTNLQINETKKTES